MLQTSARLLRLLSLLETRRDWTGADLAERLGVTARTVRSDMRGPGLSALFLDLLTGGGGKTRVLQPSGSNGTQLLISDASKRRAVDQLLHGR